ncbi:MFS transporter [Geobacillus kaustophilus]|uniref:MFS transporter n=1 Tax=Geobacillus kaustophilus TaxID=1462 RepID=UPI0027DB5C49|nr:aromatic acid/H+ symport family MFS transporter [Geobacillus kaustophilus]WMJ20354.1 aromatic acid/H+ symport family MFS transporter [Geobacillus kaustophilus]
MRSININHVIDHSRFNFFHFLLVFWCGFVIMFDGYDLVIYGAAIPVFINEWSLSPAQAGALGSYALIGMMLGALIFGTAADKFGRKNVILLCIAIFSLFTGLIAFCNNPTQFGIYRFLSGLGLGGVMPNAVALTTEYSPKSLRSTLVGIMFSGYSLGGMLSAGLAIILLPRFGWESLFLVGAIPLLCLPIMYKVLPDSPSFLVMKKDKEQIINVLSKIDPSYRYLDGDTFEVTDQKQEGIPITKLFTNQRALSTIMIWITFFMCLLMIYGLNTWLPKLMMEAGYPIDSSIMFLMVLNFGAILGAIFGGWIADRWGAKKVLVLFFILGSVSLILLGFKGNIVFLYILVGIAGACTIGTQIIANAYVSQYYPADMRSSGIGWALGIGRLGAIVGPLMGGILLNIHLNTFYNFVAFAIPGLIAAICVWIIREHHSSHVPNVQQKPELSSLESEI